MSTNLMSFEACFQGPYTHAETLKRAKLFGGLMFTGTDVETWYEVFIHFTREDDAAPIAVTPELLVQVFGEDMGMAGALPLAQLCDRDPETYMYPHIMLVGDFRTPRRVTTLAYIDARMLPADPQDFEIDSTSYRGKPEYWRSLVFAPARPATLLSTLAVDAPATLVEHVGALYVGCAGKYSSKVGGLFRCVDGAATEVKLAKKAPKVHALLSDGDTLWVGASNGLYRVEGDVVVQIFGSKTGLPGRSVLSLARHGDRVFVGCSGGYAWLIDGALDGHKQSTFKNTAHLCVDTQGTLWIGSEAALYRVAAGQYDFERIPGYRAISALAATDGGVYASLFRGGYASAVMRFHADDAIEMCDIRPVGALGGDLLVDNGGLVRAIGDAGERILFDDEPSGYVVLGDRLFALHDDRVVEVDPASWDVPATVECPTLHSPITQPLGEFD